MLQQIKVLSWLALKITNLLDKQNDCFEKNQPASLQTEESPLLALPEFSSCGKSENNLFTKEDHKIVTGKW